MSTLEQQLADLIRKHGLCHIALNATRTDDGMMFYVNAQSDGGADRFCSTSAYDCETFVDALPSAIELLNAKRNTTITLAPMVEHRTNPHTGEGYTVVRDPNTPPADRHACEQCCDTGIIYNNADPSSGQSVDCDRCAA